jgi:hypothetical protein
MYKKRENKAKQQKFGRRRDTIPGSQIRRLTDCAMVAWLQVFDTKYLYSDRHYESPNLEVLGKVHIFRHDKHWNFYRTVNMCRLILQKFLNYKSTDLWQKPRTYWIRKLRHFKGSSVLRHKLTINVTRFNTHVHKHSWGNFGREKDHFQDDVIL